MTVYIVPLHAKKLNVNQFMIGFHSLFNRIQFNWNTSYDLQDFISYYQDLQSEQPFLAFKTKKDAFNYVESNQGVEPGYLVTIRSHAPVYKVELDVKFDDIPSNEHHQKIILKSNVERLLSAFLRSSQYEGDIEKYQQEKTEFDDNIAQLQLIALNPLLNPDVKKSLNSVIDCIQQPEYKSLDFEKKNEITKMTILFIEGTKTPEEYKRVIQRGYRDYGSLEFKIIGAAMMALAIVVSACLLAVGAPVIGSLCMGAGIGMIGGGFFGMGQGPILSKPLHEVLDASAAFASVRAV